MQVGKEAKRQATAFTARLKGRPTLVAAIAFLAVGICLVAAIGALGAGESVQVLKRGSDPLATDPSKALSTKGDDDARDDSVDVAQEEHLVVDVGGAVLRPGVVELEAGSRVDDAIEAAGGLLDDADVSGINRAAPLVDGQKVFVPQVGQNSSEQGADAPSSEASAANAADVGGNSNGLVSINMATAEELDTLPGVGPSTAAAIVREREANGPFASLEDLMRVSGIGEKKFAKLKDSICL